MALSITDIKKVEENNDTVSYIPSKDKDVQKKNTKPKGYEYFTDEMAEEYGVTDPEEIQAMRNALYDSENSEPKPSDYYYNTYLKGKNA